MPRPQYLGNLLKFGALHVVLHFCKAGLVLAGFDQPPPGGVVPGMAPGFVVPGMTGLQAAALPGPAFSAPPGADVSAMGALPQGAERCTATKVPVLVP